METLSKLTQKINEMNKIISDSTCREKCICASIAKQTIFDWKSLMIKDLTFELVLVDINLFAK